MKKHIQIIRRVHRRQETMTCQSIQKSILLATVSTHNQTRLEEQFIASELKICFTLRQLS